MLEVGTTTLQLDAVTGVFDALRANRPAVRATTVEQRIERLRRLGDEIELRAADVAAGIHADLGRPLDSRDEINTVLGNIRKATAELAVWAAPLEVQPSGDLPAPKRMFVQYEPRGVVLLFGTWDFPIGMFFSPLVQAIAAGNVVIAKTNSMAPATGKMIVEILRAVFPENEVAAFDDTHVDTPDGLRPLNDVLLELRVDHIFLTGSPRVGKLIVAAAAKNLTTFTLELGGKSPTILDTTADLDLVAQRLVRGKIYNHGQTCLTVDYLWLPPQLQETFIEKFHAAVHAAFYEGDVFQFERDGRFVDKRNFERVKALLDNAVDLGATVAFGGRANEDDLVIEPTVLTDVPREADILTEEIFGPILPTLTYRSEQEIWDHSDALPKPLGMYVYSQDDTFVQRVLDHTTSGGVTVNGHSLHWADENLPFGGVNSSGYGRYHGIWGFREFSNPRLVYIVDHQPAAS